MGGGLDEHYHWVLKTSSILQWCLGLELFFEVIKHDIKSIYYKSWTTIRVYTYDKFSLAANSELFVLKGVHIDKNITNVFDISQYKDQRFNQRESTNKGVYKRPVQCRRKSSFHFALRGTKLFIKLAYIMKEKQNGG